MRPPPTLHQDVFSLTGMLLEALEDGRTHPVLRENLAKLALELLDAVVVSIRRPDGKLLDAAEATLIRLHAQISLAHALRVLGQEDFTMLSEQGEHVGALLTRWRKTLSL